MAEDLSGPPSTTWERLTPGPSITNDLLEQVIEQAAAAAAAAAAAEAAAEAALAGVDAAAASALLAEQSAAAAQAAAAAAALQAIAAAASAAAAQAAVDAINTAGGTVKISKDGGVQTQVATLDLQQNLEFVLDGDIAHVFAPVPAETDTSIALDDIEYLDVVTGSLPIGRLSALLRSVASHKCWVRFYATAADRTADASRLITDDPTTNILAEFLHNPTLTIAPPNPLLLGNNDDPTVGDIYYSITFLEITLGAFGTVATDTLVGGVSDVNIQDHIPSTPGATGWATWEIANGGNLDRYVVWATFGGFKGSANDDIVARTDVDFSHLKLRVVADVYRLAADSLPGAGGVAAYIPNTVIGSYANDNYLRALITRDTASDVKVRIERVEVGGAVTLLGISTAFGMALNSGVRLTLEVNEITGLVKAFVGTYGTGASEVEKVSVSIPGNLPSASRHRVGWWSNTATSSGFISGPFHIEEAVNTPLDATVELTTVMLEA
jgi:hypothetical protein